MKIQKGFTLIEMMVAVGLFAILILIMLSTLLALTNANRKAQALQSVMNNLNIALDGMVRTIRTGTNYHCGIGSYAGGGASDDCAAGDTRFSFEPFGGSPSPGDEIVYAYDAGTKSIRKSKDNGGSFFALTAPEVVITDLKFYVVGTARGGTGNTVQPKVVISIKGVAGAGNAKTQETFSMQATAVQRVLDI